MKPLWIDQQGKKVVWYEEVYIINQYFWFITTDSFLQPGYKYALYPNKYYTLAKALELFAKQIQEEPGKNSDLELNNINSI